MENKKELQRQIIEKLNTINDYVIIEIAKNMVYLFEDMDNTVLVKDSTYGGINLNHFYDLIYGDKKCRVMVNNTVSVNRSQIKFIIIDSVNNFLFEFIEVGEPNYFPTTKGIYLLINENNPNDRYNILISGKSPLMKFEAMWDFDYNIIKEDDEIFNRNFIWIKK